MSERYEAPKSRSEYKEPAGFYDYATQTARIRTELLWKQIQLAAAKAPLAYDKMIDRGALTKNQLESAEHNLLRNAKKPDGYITPRDVAKRERIAGYVDARDARVGTDKTRELSAYLRSTAELYRANVDHLAKDFDHTLVIPTVLTEVEQQVDRAFLPQELEASKTLRAFVSEFKDKMAKSRAQFASVIAAYPTDMRSSEYDDKKKETQIMRDSKRSKAMLTSISSLSKEMQGVDTIYEDIITRLSAAETKARKKPQPSEETVPLSAQTRAASGALDALPDAEVRSLTRFKNLLQQERINNIRQYAITYKELIRAFETHIKTGKKLRAAEIHLGRMLAVRTGLHAQRESKRDKIGELMQVEGAWLSQKANQRNGQDDFVGAYLGNLNGHTPPVEKANNGWSLGLEEIGKRPENDIVDIVMGMRNRALLPEDLVEEGEEPVESDEDIETAEPTLEVIDTPTEPKRPQPPVKQNEPIPVELAPIVAESAKEESKPKVLVPKPAEKKKGNKEKTANLEKKRKILRGVIGKLKEEKLPKPRSRNSWAEVVNAFKKEKLPEEAMQAVQEYINSQEALRQGLNIKFGPNGRKFLIDVLEQVEQTLV